MEWVLDRCDIVWPQVEKIVEVKVGEEELKALREREEEARKDKEEYKKRAAEDMKQLLGQCVSCVTVSRCMILSPPLG